MTMTVRPASGLRAARHASLLSKRALCSGTVQMRAFPLRAHTTPPREERRAAPEEAPISRPLDFRPFVRVRCVRFDDDDAHHHHSLAGRRFGPICWPAGPNRSGGRAQISQCVCVMGAKQAAVVVSSSEQRWAKEQPAVSSQKLVVRGGKLARRLLI